MISQHDPIARALDEARSQSRLFTGAIALIEKGRPPLIATTGVEASALFEIGSITKLLTAIATLRSGVDLDSPAESLVPGLRFDERRGAEVTLRHLLTHSSGLPAAGRDWGPHDSEALRRFALTDLAHHRFHARPGSVGCYSSTAISLVGLALQESTGTAFPELIHSLILEPSGATGAGFPTEVDSGNVSWPHSREVDQWQPVPRLADNPAGYPSGFLMASVEHMAQVALALLTDELDVDARALIGTTVSRWMDHASTPHGRASAHFGLGCFTGEWSGHTVVRHGGGQLTSNCSIDLFPDTGGAVVLLTNGADDAAFMELLSLCYTAAVGPSGPIRRSRTAGHDRRLAETATGFYLDLDAGNLVIISTDSQGLQLAMNDSDPEPLIHLGDGRWALSSDEGDIPVGIPRNGDDLDHVFVWGQLHVRIDDPVVAPITDSHRFTGTYADTFWDDTRSRLVVSAVGEQLVISDEAVESVARPLDPNRFASGHGLVEFKDDGLILGNATGYTRVGDG